MELINEFSGNGNSGLRGSCNRWATESAAAVATTEKEKKKWK